MRLNNHPDQHTYLPLSDKDELKVTRKIIQLSREGRYGSYRNGTTLIEMSGEEARILNLALVRIDELEHQANEFEKEISRESKNTNSSPVEAS